MLHVDYFYFLYLTNPLLYHYSLDLNRCSPPARLVLRCNFSFLVFKQLASQLRKISALLVFWRNDRVLEFPLELVAACIFFRHISCVTRRTRSSTRSSAATLNLRCSAPTYQQNYHSKFERHLYTAGGVEVSVVR